LRPVLFFAREILDVDAASVDLIFNGHGQRLCGRRDANQKECHPEPSLRSRAGSAKDLKKINSLRDSSATLRMTVMFDKEDSHEQENH